VDSVEIIKVVHALEQFAPLPLQEDFDNAGLQVGLTDAEVSGALLCLDVTEETVDEAISLDCNLIISHHPLIFHKLARLCGENYVQRTVMKALANHITIASMHTNMDEAEGGVNFMMAEKLKLSEVEFIGKRKNVEGVEAGEGVIGRLPEPLAADDFVLTVKDTFGVEMLQANQLLRRPIATVALCGGAGSFMLDEAIKAGADAFITGEMHYHEFFGHEQQIQIAVIGHYQSEKFTAEVFQRIINDKCPGVRTVISTVNTNPIIYF